MTVSPSLRVIESRTATAEAVDESALVLRWSPTGRDEVLFAHPAVGVRAGVPPHAGIPVCWPWFGPGPAPEAPTHGFARSATWRHLGSAGDDDTSTVRYELTSDDATSQWWPHPYRLELAVTVGDVLTLALTTTNTGEAPVQVGEALHAYLAVGDVREIVVRGLGGAPYYDKVTGEDLVQQGDLVLAGETDRVYRCTTAVLVDDPVLRRRLRVEAEGAANRVVWNPWDAKAAEADDIADAWPRFVCVEAANALDDVVTVPGGGSHTITYRLTVEDL